MTLRKRLMVLAASLFFAAMAGSVVYAADPDSDEEDEEEEEDYSFKEATITITNPKQGHIYDAYQIFKDDRAVFGKEMNVFNAQWGKNVDGEGIYQDLLNDDRGYDWGLQYVAQDKNPAYDIALSLYDNKTQNTDEKTRIFAEIAADHLNEEAPAATSQHTEGSKEYTINVKESGYYLICDRIDKDHPIAEGDAATRYILWKADDTTIKVKADAPPLEKKILEDDTEKDDNQVSIGDTVTYLLNSKVPDMQGYETYIYEIRDTLSAGLTFEDDVKVQIDGTDVPEKLVHVTHEANQDKSTSVKIRLDLLDDYKASAGKSIRVTYTGILNENAVIGGTGNPNEAKLIYSNNPAESEEGHEPEGKTPLDKVVTYTAGIRVLKINSLTKEPLTGAEFTLTGTQVNKVKVSRQEFTKDAAGTWYKLKNGSFTETAPTGDLTGRYESTTDRYAAKTVTEIQEKKENVDVKAVVGEDGVLTFDGLGASDEAGYLLTETKAPSGYQGITKPVTVHLNCTLPDTEKDPTFSNPAVWTYTIGDSQEEKSADGGIVEVTVENAPGITFPSAGGRGTAGLTILGILSLIAGTILIASRRNHP